MGIFECVSAMMPNDDDSSVFVIHGSLKRTTDVKLMRQWVTVMVTSQRSDINVSSAQHVRKSDFWTERNSLFIHLKSVKTHKNHLGDRSLTDTQIIWELPFAVCEPDFSFKPLDFYTNSSMKNKKTATQNNNMLPLMPTARVFTVKQWRPSGKSVVIERASRH